MTDSRNGYFGLQRALHTDTGLQSLSDIKAIHEATIKALASEACDAVVRWMAPYPSFLLNRVRSTSLACAVMCPDTGLGPVVTAMKIGAILFAIDDVVDGTRAVPRDDEADSLLVTCRDVVLEGGRIDLRSRMASLIAPLSSEVTEPWKEACEALARYCEELLVMPRSELYYPFFSDMFTSAMDGMRSEVRSRRTFIEEGSVPDYDAYLASGRKSIASPALYAATLVSLAPDMDPLEFRGCADALREFAFTAGSCVRLANDVRSFARETEIEQRPNSVLVLIRTRGISEQQAEEIVISQADACLTALGPLSAKLPTPLRPWTEAVQRFTSLIRDWYMVRELHE